MGLWGGHSCIVVRTFLPASFGGADIPVCVAPASAGAYSPSPIRTDKNVCPTRIQECLPHRNSGMSASPEFRNVCPTRIQECLPDRIQTMEIERHITPSDLAAATARVFALASHKARVVEST